jgi:hypothetical protein
MTEHADFMTEEALTRDPPAVRRGGRDKSELDPIKAASAARAIRESLATIAGDDDDLMADMVEGETNLFEIVDRLLERITLNNALADGVQRHLDEAKGRRERFEARVATDRALIEQALVVAGVEASIQRPIATLGLSKRGPKLVIDEEADIPAEYWKAGDPVLDRKALKEALERRDAQIALAVQLAESAHPGDPKAREAALERALANLGPIPGARLEQPAPSLTIRIK